MKILISMTDFVLADNGIHQTVNYANFLKQPLELWMFVPCDEDGNVLEEPDADYYMMVTKNEILKYQQAKERCLFEGFSIKDGIVFTPEKQIMVQQSLLRKMTVENLIDINLTLTATAQKQIS